MKINRKLPNVLETPVSLSSHLKFHKISFASIISLIVRTTQNLVDKINCILLAGRLDTFCFSGCRSWSWSRSTWVGLTDLAARGEPWWTGSRRFASATSSPPTSAKTPQLLWLQNFLQDLVNLDLYLKHSSVRSHMIKGTSKALNPYN